MIAITGKLKLHNQQRNSQTKYSISLNALENFKENYLTIDICDYWFSITLRKSSSPSNLLKAIFNHHIGTQQVAAKSIHMTIKSTSVIKPYRTSE